MTTLNGLPNAMAYEWTRIRTTRLGWWLVAASLVATALAAWAYSGIALRLHTGASTIDAREAVVFVISKSSAAPIVAGILGVFAVGTDYRFATMRTTLLVTPRRRVALAAKAVVVCGLGAVLALVDLAVAWGVGLLVLDGRVSLAINAVDFVHLLVAQMALTAGWALFGMSTAVIARSQIFALVTMLTVPFVLESVVRSVGLLSGQGWLEHLGGYLPFTAGAAMTDITHRAAGALLTSRSARVGPLLGAVIFLGMIALMASLADARYRRQDVN